MFQCMCHRNGLIWSRPSKDQVICNAGLLGPVILLRIHPGKESFALAKTHFSADLFSGVTSEGDWEPSLDEQLAKIRQSSM